MLQKFEISACLIGLLARIQTLPYPRTSSCRQLDCRGPNLLLPFKRHQSVTFGKQKSFLSKKTSLNINTSKNVLSTVGSFYFPSRRQSCCTCDFQSTLQLFKNIALFVRQYITRVAATLHHGLEESLPFIPLSSIASRSRA